ncbi:MAG TPA: hypothetical protein VLH19_01945 [Patescibacteria group bacterium]|nr:hypothetical protein [Patescibacteria group bacterium]
MAVNSKEQIILPIDEQTIEKILAHFQRKKDKVANPRDREHLQKILSGLEVFLFTWSRLHGLPFFDLIIDAVESATTSAAHAYVSAEREEQFFYKMGEQAAELVRPGMTFSGILRSVQRE